jgi:hypothetical protein
VDPSEPGGDHAGPSDHTHIPSLPQHRHQQGRQDPEAGPRADHVRYPSQPVLIPPERRRKRGLRINLRGHAHTRSAVNSTKGQGHYCHFRTHATEIGSHILFTITLSFDGHETQPKI